MMLASKTDALIRTNARERPYTARFTKGGALLPEMRRLVSIWDGTVGAGERIVRSNLVSLPSRARAQDVVRRAFLPRFVDGEPRNLWRPLAVLERSAWPSASLAPIYYYATASAEPILWDFVVDVLAPKYGMGEVGRWGRAPFPAGVAIVLFPGRAMERRGCREGLAGPS